jgi:type II secretory pathway pseudopilin PulG
MGQQQLLLLVLGIVIVGIAVVAGIQAFSEGRIKAQRDAAVSDAMRIISDTQAWMLKPAAFGGPESDATVVTWQAIGFPTSSLTDGNYTTTNGCYTLGGTAASVSLGVYSGENTLDDEPGCDEKIADVFITGPNSDNISWRYDLGAE